MEEFQVTNGVFIRLQTDFPGSQHGRETAMQRLVSWGINKISSIWPPRRTDARGVKIGADVPYCIMRGTALSEGIGERTDSSPAYPRAEVLLANQL